MSDKNNMNRIGIYAGIFDPIHDGHLAAARSAVVDLQLDTLFFLVEKSGWGGKTPIPLQKRQDMVAIATQDDLQLRQLESKEDRFDTDRTLTRLEREYVGDELYFVFGADVFMNMNTAQWPGLEKLLKHYIVVFERKNISQSDIAAHAKELGIVVAILPSEYMEHSSTNVRLKPHDRDIWVPKTVSDYIEHKGLYI